VVPELLPRPVAGRDYPKNWNQFLDWFPDETACLSYLERLRWPAGFECPRCGEQDEPYRAKRSRLMCRHCGHQGTVTAGTVFSKTRTPLRSWFAAVWYVTNQKNGVSALGLQRVLGLGSYQTAWAILHRLRRATIRPGREQLSGKVEVDETFVGGPGRGQKRKNTAGMRRWKDETAKAIVAIAVEVHDPKGFGRIRLRRVPQASESYLLPFICDVIREGSVVHTDGSPAYRSVSVSGYVHERTVVTGSPTPAHVSMPAVNRVSSLLKRWLLGTHQGSVQPHQLDYYLDEYTFRFNRRTSRSRGMLFYRLLEQAVATEPVTYRDIASQSA
jgi:transposase-like protein/predicted RNA-binding Zn-ribbon protein involved in translation (DUF1610 family)